MARWLAVEAQVLLGFTPMTRTTVKNESGTHEFPCSSAGATPLGKRPTGGKKKVDALSHIPFLQYTNLIP